MTNSRDSCGTISICIYYCAEAYKLKEYVLASNSHIIHSHKHITKIMLLFMVYLDKQKVLTL